MTLFLTVFAGLAWAANDAMDVILQVSSNMTATIQWAVPEGRVGADETNWDSEFFLAVRTADDNDDIIIYTMPTLATTTVEGKLLTPINLGSITAGVYDVTIKGHQHLSLKLDDVTLSPGANQFNFTQADNSVTLGDRVMLAGDISGSTSSPSVMGDDVINSVDLGIIIDVLDNDDPTGNAIRANLNQDIVVNSVDLSLLIKNLDLEGDK